LTDDELDRISTGTLLTTRTVQIGDANSGAMTVSAAISHKNNLVLETGAELTFHQTLKVENQRALTLRTGQVISAIGDGVDIDAGILGLGTQGTFGAVDNAVTVYLNGPGGTGDDLNGTVNGDLFVREVRGEVSIAEPLSVGANTIHFLGGKFVLGASDPIDNASHVNVNGAILDLGSRSETVAGVRLTAGQITGIGVLTSMTAFQVEDGSISAKLHGAVGLNKTTGGTVTLTAENTFAGPTIIAGGVLSILKDEGLGMPPVAPTPNHLVLDGGTLSWNGTGSLTLSAGRGIGLGGEFSPGSGTIEVASGELSYDGVIADRSSGAGQFIKTGPHLLTLTGVNTYSGGTVIDEGELRISGDRALGAVPASETPGHLQLRGTLGVRESFEIASTRSLVLGPGSGTLDVPEGLTLTYNGKIADHGAGSDRLIKTGRGTLVLGGDSTFSGGTDYADECTIRIDHENGLGVGEIRFGTKATLQYGVGVTKDLSGRLSSWDESVMVTIDTNGNDVVFASPFSTDGTLVKKGEGTLRLDNQGTPLEETSISVLSVEGGELAVTAGTLHLTGGKTPDVLGIAYTDLTSLFVKGAAVTIAGGTVLTEESLLVGFVVDAALRVTGGRLEVRGDLVAGTSADGTVHISGDSSVRVIVRGDFIGGYQGGGSGEISGGITQIEGNLIAGKDGTWKVNVSGGTLKATSLRHVGGDDGALNLTGGTVEVDEVVHQTSNNGSDDSLKVYLGAVGQNVRGTLITKRMYMDRTGGVDDGHTHEFLLFFDGGTLEAKAGGNLIDGITDEVGNPVWQGLIDAVGPLNASAFIYIPGNFDANVLRPLLHDPLLADTRDGGLTKQGTGKLTLKDENTFMGPVIIQSGTLALVNIESNNTIEEALYIDVQEGTKLDVTGLDDRREDPAVVGTLILADAQTLGQTLGQTLLGYGTVEGRLIAASGSIVSPGRSTFYPPGAPGVLSVIGNYTMNLGSTLDIEIYGNTIDPNDILRQEYDQVEVFGEVRLNEATLIPPAFNGYRPVSDDEFVIINNDGQDQVVGTFAGLPEGTVFENFLGSGLPFRISYVGGDGNDVVIASFAAPEPTIELVKTGSFQDENEDGNADPGETIRYSFTVTNTGKVTLTDVTLADPGIMLAGGPIATLAPGESDTTTFTGSYAIRWADIEAGSFSNTATVTGLDPNQQPVTATSQAIVPLPPPPILVLGPDKNPGTLQEVRVVDGDQGDVFWQFVAYENYVGGTRVAVADLNGDGSDEIITAPGRNHPPEIRIFTLQGDPVPGFPEFLAYDPAFISGVQLTVGYVDEDHLPDLITVPSYGAAEVRVFLNQYDPDDAGHAIPAFRADPDISFQAFPVASIGGAVVAAGDMGRRVGDSFVKEPDGRAEIVVGTGNGTPAAVALFDVAGPTPTRLTEFVPFATSNPGFLGGVSLDVALIDEDTIPDVIVGMGVNGASEIEVWTWNASGANLSLLGAIPNAFTGSSSNASISVAAADTDGSGFADAIFAVQGPVGTTREIHRFDILVDAAAAPPFSYQPAMPLAGFTGPWFIATGKTLPLAAASEPAVPIVPPPVNAWTNLVNPWDVNGDGRVTPLDALETINYINGQAGETALPPLPFSPPRFFDSNADDAITPADVLVVLNYLNANAASLGEGETSAPWSAPWSALWSALWSETDVINGFPAAAPGPAMPGAESPAADRPRDRGVGVFDLPGLPVASWPPSTSDAASRRAPGFVELERDEIDVFALDAILEEIAAEIAAFV
jgi:autotransporter-associated beta strand protein